MRPTLRALARHLEPGTQTGLTGLWTHATPRSTLLFLYGSTLARLERLPASSLYRQSVEAVTRHRLALVEATKPPGHEEWAAEARKKLQPAAATTSDDAEGGRGGREEEVEFFRVASGRMDINAVRSVRLGGRVFLVEARRPKGDVREEEWDGEDVEGGFSIGGIPTRAEVAEYEAYLKSEFGLSDKDLEERDRATEEAERKRLAEPTDETKLKKMIEEAEEAQTDPTLSLGEEPQLTADQIKELEGKIGAGLIEEVIEVAEGELKMINVMEKAKVWEDLEEKPVEGQWKYFERS